MSDPITQFGIVSNLYSTVCLNYRDDLWTGFFIMMDWWPWMVGFIFVGLLIEHAEVFYAMFAIALVGDFYINWGIRIAIDQAPPEIFCTTQQQMPAYATDGISFITMTLMILSAVVFNFSLRWYKIILIAVLGPIAIYARIWLHNNTPQQLLAGILSGFINTLVWSTLIYIILTKWYARIVYKTFLGTDYIDTLIHQFQPVLCYNNIPIRSNNKIKDHLLLEGIINHSIMQGMIKDRCGFESVPENNVEAYLQKWAPAFVWASHF